MPTNIESATSTERSDDILIPESVIRSMVSYVDCKGSHYNIGLWSMIKVGFWCGIVEVGLQMINRVK